MASPNNSHEPHSKTRRERFSQFLASNWHLGKSTNRYEFALTLVLPLAGLAYSAAVFAQKAVAFVLGLFISQTNHPSLFATAVASAVTLSALLVPAFVYWLQLKVYSLKQKAVDCECYPGQRNCSHIHKLLSEQRLPHKLLVPVGQQKAYDFKQEDGTDVRHAYLEVVRALADCASHSIHMTLPRSPYAQICSDEWRHFKDAMFQVRDSNADRIVKTVILDSDGLDTFIDGFAWDFACNGGCRGMKSYLSCHYGPVHNEASRDIKRRFDDLPNAVDLKWRIPGPGEPQSEFLRIENEMDITLKATTADTYDFLTIDFQAAGQPPEVVGGQPTNDFFEDNLLSDDSVLWESIARYFLVKKQYGNGRVIPYERARELAAAISAEDALRLSREAATWQKAIRTMVEAW